MAADPVAAWADSGAMWLSRGAGNVPQCAPGTPAALITSAFDALGLRLPGAAVLGERAALAGLAPASSISAGGATRLLKAHDGHIALSLARPGDADLVSALVEREFIEDPWTAVSCWLESQPAVGAVARAQLLGLPAAVVPGPEDAPDEQTLERGGIKPVVVTAGGARRHDQDLPLIVDLSSLWAGPLCAHLLGLRGAVVVKVEDDGRLDGARSGSRAFYNLLHAGHQSVTLDLRSAAGVGDLRRLLLEADLVIESSRPRALTQLGIDALEFVDRGTCWLSITAYGRTGPWSNRVGFGDDVAAGAGMVAHIETGIAFLGDALADPMTGVFAAQVAAAALGADDAQLLDVSMRDVVASTLGPVPDHEVIQTGPDTWEVVTATGRHVVAPPRLPARRGPACAAAAPGEDNDRWLAKR